MLGKNMALLTDLYELTMMQGYFKNGDKNKIAVFDMFYRKNPYNGSYAIIAGLDQVIQYINNLHFSKEDILYLNSLGIFETDFLDYLSNFKFTGSIWSVPEGSIIFPQEPIVKVIGPIIEAQLIETALLNIVNFQSLIATKASRVCFAAQGDEVMEFGARRAQGQDASVYGARAAIIGGCSGTSNVLAGKLFDVPVKGTNAHSWVMSFSDELSAFQKFTDVYSKNFTLISDTYDTLKSGIPNAIHVFNALKKKGIHPNFYGVRLDSGDLTYLSKEARDMFDRAGFSDASIIGSSDLDEFSITSLKSQGAEITHWAVGTSLITSKGCSSFGGVYKLSAIQESGEIFSPKIKISEDLEKATYPGNKKIFRIYDKKNGLICADLICLENEYFREDRDIVAVNPLNNNEKIELSFKDFNIKEQLIEIFCKGEKSYISPSVWEIREFCQKELKTLNFENRRLTNSQKIPVLISEKLYTNKELLLSQK
jgi:nicotinate phosphoribosyltransferase